MQSIIPHTSDTLEIREVRKHFPALSTGRASLDNAAGSLILGDAIDA